MSKFFRGISSSESSDSDESGDEAPVVQSQRPLVRDFAYPSDSDDEGPKRVVRAQKDKMYEELKEQIRVARNARNIKDISKLLSAFEALCRIYEKTKSIIAREGLTIPRFYIRYLAEVEDFINEQWEDKEGRKIMSKANAKSLTTMRQKVRKYNKDFESEILAYREAADPVGYSSGAAEEDDEEIEQEKPVAAQKKEGKKKAAAPDSDIDSDSEWGEVTSDSSSESDIDFEGKKMEELRQYFLK
ncbi:eukaryotic translation initiation factor 3 subunit C [Ditylenchus destructor]|uniref:Eukaryotic translation initiation factor 3 subunit C n=1 Tax=Ditylenchus destructor TaxID=166010 RepID=A0AAD4MP59_9BILA|nr:eukaryotic translation initiation factor 3 subunit C [Ditylenchus destructor]